MTPMEHTCPFEPTLVLTSNSPEETAAIAERFAALLRAGDTVSLEGDLGAGKTFFTRQVAASLGSTDRVSSPTFVLQKNYSLNTEKDEAPDNMVHYDTYRLGDYHEMVDIGFEDAGENTVSFVEWGDRFVDCYPGTVIRIRIEHTGEHSRRFSFLLPDDRKEF